MKKEKLSNKTFIILSVFAILIIIFSFYGIFKELTELERKTLEVKYEVGTKNGFNVESEKLNFGRLLPGNLGTRTILIENKHSFPVYAKIRLSPSINNLITFNSSEHYIQSGETLNISISIKVPVDAKIGNYSGFIVAYIRK